MRKFGSFRKNSKAISPVISTIIIVAVSIVMSIAAAYWMLGLGTAFTRFEKLEFTNAYAFKQDGKFEIRMTIRNTGTAALSIGQVFLNGKPVSVYNNTASVNWTTTTLEPGQQTDGTISLTIGNIWSSGMTVEVSIQTAAGREYPRTVALT
jgi:FlaG/FlaF family flagellin (archaellin)